MNPSCAQMWGDNIFRENPAKGQPCIRSVPSCLFRYPPPTSHRI